MGNLLPKKMGFFFSGKNPQFKFSKVVKGGAVVSFELSGSWLLSAQNNYLANMAHLGRALWTLRLFPRITGRVLNTAWLTRIWSWHFWGGCLASILPSSVCGISFLSMVIVRALQHLGKIAILYPPLDPDWPVWCTHLIDLIKWH